MLCELRIQNFAVIKDVQLKFGPGMVIISGEEGAGKSLILDALGILLGSRASSNIIRSKAVAARVEGVFWIPETIAERINPLFEGSDIELESDGMLVISRDVQQQGRSIARINSKAIPISLLRQIGQNLVDLHGQTDYISLLDMHRQLDLLDAHGNLVNQRNRLSHIIDELRQHIHELSSLNSTMGDERRELLEYQVDEIERSNLQIGEDQSLIDKRELLLRAESLKESCLKAYDNLYGEERSSTTLIHEALVALKGLNGNSSPISLFRDQLEETMANLEEIARELRNYGDSVESDALQLDEIEQRLTLLSSLKRKYGGSVESVLSYHSNAKEELEEIQSHHEHNLSLENKKDRLEIESGKLAEELSLSRRRAAKSLTSLVNEELSDLGLPWAKFDIRLHRQEDENGLPITGKKRFAFTREGIDTVEFFIATNPGEPMRPLSAIASGGETCRIMLAIKSALNRVDPIPTLVFDEIDGGVGGRSGETMGKKLATIADQHQVLCITHLPHIACFGDLHIKLIKEKISGRSVTRAESVDGHSRINELADMLGSKQAGQPMIDGASNLLGQARSWKEKDKEVVSLN
jgi:DNA repair protein RecN (Recombination protein N)